MLPIHPLLLTSPTPSTDMHTFLVSQHRFLLSLYKQNIEKLRSLQTTLGLLQTDEAQTLPGVHSEEFFNTLQANSSIYNAKLELVHPLTEFVCKSKYFNLSVRLVTESVQIRNEDKFSVIASLYTSETVPKIIRCAGDGRNIFRGNTKVVMAFEDGQHVARFRLQIKEVSSLFENGIFKLVIEVEESLGCSLLCVEPLVIENLRVRAKEYYVDLLNRDDQNQLINR